MNRLKEQIKTLEERLLHSDVSKNPKVLDELLSDDFEELGGNGKVSSRADVIEWLVKKDKDMRWSLCDFRIRELTPDLLVAIYRAVSSGQANSSSNGSMRSSLWQNFDGQWKMVFHQGTKIVGSND